MFAENHEELVKLETEISAISSDGLDKRGNLSSELDLPYPLLAHPEGKVIEEYTHCREDKKTAAPSVFSTDIYGALYY